MVLAHGLRSVPNPSSTTESAYTIYHHLDAILYLCDSERSPFLLPQQLQCASRAVEVIFGNDLEHLLGKLHVTVLIHVVRVSLQLSALDASKHFERKDAPCRIVNCVNKLVQLLLLVLG